MTDKERYVQEEMSKHLQFWSACLPFSLSRSSSSSGSPTISLRREFQAVLILRFGFPAFSASCSILNTLSEHLLSACHYNDHHRHLYPDGRIYGAVLRGHASSYYAGLLLTIVGAFGFIAFNMPFSLAIAALIYALYNVPYCFWTRSRTCRRISRTTSSCCPCSRSR